LSGCLTRVFRGPLVQSQHSKQSDSTNRLAGRGSPLQESLSFNSIKGDIVMTEAATQAQMEHTPGSFCWIELATTDGPGGKKFYSELFGWEALDNPIGPGMVYTMLKLNG